MSQMRIKRKPKRERYVDAAVGMVTDVYWGADAGFEADKKWFKEHPGETEYVRPVRPGEFGNIDLGDVVKVLVVYEPPNMRGRVPLIRVRQSIH